MMNNDYNRIVNALGFDEKLKRQSSFAFCKNPAPKEWKAFTFDASLPTYLIVAPKSNVTQMRSFLNGIQAENYIVLANLENHDLLVMKRSKKGENQQLIIPLRKQDDYDRVVNVFQRLRFTSDELTAHSSLTNAMELIKTGAERYFINRGLFSNHFLKERLPTELPKRKRNQVKEARDFLSKLNGEIPTNPEGIKKILESLGYKTLKYSNEYLLEFDSSKLQAAVITATAENMDVKTNDSVPTYQAVSALSRFPWVILTNGRLWRLYSSRVSSASTNYFEIDLESVTDEKDPKLLYFVSIFSALSLVPKKGITDLDLIFDGGVRYANEIESDLKNKIFNEQLFLNLVRGILDHSFSNKYSQKELEASKALALKLLYRFLFILYAESRALLPVEHSGYNRIALGSIRERLIALEKDAESTVCWNNVKKLFKSISEGDPSANLPQYDGELFEYDQLLDGLQIRNKFLVPTIRDLTEIDGKGIDYQNLGVRHLGSLYEALLEYSIQQASDDLIIYDDEILDASFASDLKEKPSGYIKKGDLYLTLGGLARKGTGSYFTPDQIVRFLVKKGLESIFQERRKKFHEHIEQWRKSKDPKILNQCRDNLLDLQVLDPAMGSGHFLVAAVDEITRWIMGILQEYPDAPLTDEILEDRKKIIQEQKKRGVKLNEELLTFNVILKRMVMKRCVFGVDVNPLATELAKLSLWLDSFTIGTPLTFLDHHMKRGDGLIGLFVKNIAERMSSNETLDKWTGEVTSSGVMLQNVSLPKDITIDEIKRSKKTFVEFEKSIKPLKSVLDLLCAGIIDQSIEQRRPQNLPLVEEIIRKGDLDKIKWGESVKEAVELAKEYGFFHWELEFPDAFRDKKRGFDLVIMNPPWAAVMPDDDDFFSQHYPSFRKMKSKQEKSKIKDKLLKDISISKAYVKYKATIGAKLSFYLSSNQYNKRGKGHNDTWKLFLERAIKLMAERGSISILIPSGIVTSEGATDLRKVILERKIRMFYEFENRKQIFPDIDSRSKFVLLVLDNAAPVEEFPAAFYLHDMDSLAGQKENKKFLRFSKSLIELVSPNSLIIPECRTQEDIEILLKVYKKIPRLEDKNKKWSATLLWELNKTTNSNLFNNDLKGWPLIGGGNFHQFLPDFKKPIFSIKAEEGLRETSKRKEYSNLNEKIHEIPRLALRSVARGTDTRSVIACILPKHTFVPHSAAILIPKINDIFHINKDYYKLITYLVGIFNSLVFDYLVRMRLDKNLSFFYMYQTPTPKEIEGPIADEIIMTAGKLCMFDERFSEISNVLGIQPSKLNMKKRIELTAKLDALVAHDYGLNRNDYAHIISTFNGFKEDIELENKNEVEWDSTLIQKFNGEVRKKVLYYYDTIETDIAKRNLKQK